MREVKAEPLRIAMPLQQGGFARWPDEEPECGGFDVQVPSEHKTNTAVRQRKLDLILRTHESGGATMLLFTERGAAAFEHGCIALKRTTPNIDRV